MLIHRRSLLLGVVSSLASPAIVRAGVIMPVKTMIWDGRVPIMIQNCGYGPTYPSHAVQRKGDLGIMWWEAWDPYRKMYRAMTGFPSVHAGQPCVDWMPSDKAMRDIGCEGLTIDSIRLRFGA